MNLMNYFISFVGALHLQLTKDQARWGNEWKVRPIEQTKEWDHQNDRIMVRIVSYYDDWEDNGIPMPWTKVAGLAFIAWVREQFPDTYGK